MPLSRPLRTHRTIFTVVRSSLSNTRLGGCGEQQEVVTPVIAPARFNFADDTRCDWLASSQWSAGQPLDAGSRWRLCGPPQVLDEFLFVASSSKCFAPKDHAEVCSVTRTMMLSMVINSMVILIIIIRRSLFPRSFTRPPISLPRGRLSAGRRRSGLPRFVSITRSVRSRLDAGGWNVHATEYFSL